MYLTQTDQRYMVFEILCKTLPLAQRKPILNCVPASQVRLIMKPTAIIPSSAYLTASAKGFRQTISLPEHPYYQEYLKKFKNQVNYIIAYTPRQLSQAKRVSVEINNVTLELVQPFCFKDQPSTYTIISDNLISLRRQFPDSILANLDTDYDSLFKQLYIGQKYNDAIIVLTDIKNFSSIVSSADPDELNEAMNKYYTSARDLVFKYNGILVQFVGDSVLAIFNYPKKDLSAYINTVKFCSELILLGRATFDSLLSKMDQAIDTGTRVGVSNGPIYTLNISKGGIEITFIGDKINFAARLEKNCDVDGILLSNRFYTIFYNAYSDLAKDIDFTRKDLTPSDAKGQMSVTKAWQIQFKDIQKIINWRK